MKYSSIEFTITDGVGLLVLNRPEKLNAINQAMIDDISHLVDRIKRGEDKIGALIITGSGKAFCVGADLVEARETLEVNPVRFSRKYQNLCSNVESLGCPVIAAINGAALGGGLELSLACDFRIASDAAMLGVPEINLGGFPAGGGTQRLPRLIGRAYAKRLLYLGDSISASEGRRIGLVEMVVNPESLETEAMKLAKSLCKKSPKALETIKYLVRIGPELTLDNALELENHSFEAIISHSKPNL